VRLAACCQKEHPAGTTPSKRGTLSGATSGNETATGGRDNCKKEDKSAATFALLLIDSPFSFMPVRISHY